MGKNIISQKRGRGSPTYRTRPRAFMPRVEYKNMNGRVTNIVNDTMRNAPLLEIRYADNSIGYMVAPQGSRVGDSIERYMVPLSKVNEGEKVFAVETFPNSGPKLCMSAGCASMVASKTRDTCILKLPSKKEKKVSLNCRAMVGVPAGDGIKEKFILKAGKRHFMMRAKGKMYPRVRGVAMNAVDHPHGGSGHGKKRPPVSRDAPPGAKVGTISPRRTGKKR